MREISYHKDYRHNYLIIREDEMTGDDYQRKMITENRIRGLLPCQIRYINGETLLYYEITSRQSVKGLFEGKHLTMKELKGLFISLKMVMEETASFLLPEDGLLIEPDMIFTELEKEEFYFVYDPFSESRGTQTLITLLEFLADHVDGEDNAALQAVYHMLDLAEKEQFVLDEIVEWFGEEEQPENVPEPEKEIHEMQMEEPYPCYEEQEPAENPAIQRLISTQAAKVYLVCAVFLSVVLGYLTYTYELSEKLLVFSYAGFFLAGLLVILSLGAVIVRKLSGRKQKRETENLSFRETEEEMFSHGIYEEVCSERVQGQRKEYGDTVYIPWTANSENKLYGVGKDNKFHIDLNRLPITVGKLAGSVDMVIDNQSISRVHARFTREGTRICMTDLNSTNGTFKNGLRLTPNTSEILEPGDEIRLGKLKFVYR